MTPFTNDPTDGLSYDAAVAQGYLRPACGWRGVDRTFPRASRTSDQLAGEVRRIVRRPTVWHGVRLLIAFAVWTAAVAGVCVFAMAWAG